MSADYRRSVGNLQLSYLEGGARDEGYWHLYSIARPSAD